MENPLRWTELERSIHQVLQESEHEEAAFLCGLSRERQIAALFEERIRTVLDSEERGWLEGDLVGLDATDQILIKGVFHILRLAFSVECHRE